jgi:putative ABC transport system ATP-binding protein
VTESAEDGHVNASRQPGAIPSPEAGNRALIRFDGVSRTYPRGQVRAIREVSLQIEREEYVAVTGPSGSGKSTLLYLACGLDRADTGTVWFDGTAPKSPAEWTRLRSTRIGFVFQTFQLIAGLTAAENVELPMLGVVAGERKRRKRAAALLERVGLGDRAKHRIADLSGGEAQRVAIARALANSPSAIFADEPTGNLDSQTASQILSLLEDVRDREKAALVIVTHNALIAERATRVIKLRDGEIIGEERRRQPA